MENKRFELDKFGKTVLIIFGLYLLIMVIFFLPAYIRSRGRLYIVTNTVKIKYINGKWSNIIDDKDYKLKKFNIYQDGEFLGKYRILYSNNLLSLYDNTKKINYNGNIFGYRGNLKLDLINTEFVSTLNETDKYAINGALSELGLKNTNNLSYVEKKEIDVNNNGILDTVYCINNYYVDDDNNERFSIIFSIIDNNIKIIDKVITDNSGVEDSEILSIMNVLDVKKDKKMELLYTRNYANGSADTECAVIYDLNRGKVMNNLCE